VVSEERAEALLTEAGFTVDSRFDAGAQHYGIIAQKK
jgi:hypothetical protein